MIDCNSVVYDDEMIVKVRQWNDLKSERNKLLETNEYLREQLKQYRNQFGKLDPWMVQNDF